MPFVKLGHGDGSAYINVAEIKAVFPILNGVKVEPRKGPFLFFEGETLDEVMLEIELAEIEGQRGEQL